MGRSKGLLNISANFEPQMAAPFDAREIVGEKAELTSENIWKANDGTVYAYKGMKVVVINDTLENNGLYLLKDIDYTNISNWEKISTGTAEGINVHKDTTSPTVDDDNSVYPNNTFWINTNNKKVFILSDGTSGNAEWVDLTSSVDFFVQDFDTEDWVLNAGRYELEITHNLTTFSPVISIFENNQLVTVSLSVINENKVKIFTSIDPDLRFAGKIKIKI